MRTRWDAIVESANTGDAAKARYGEFASPHEVLGVLLEEFDEFKHEIHVNDVGRARDEAIDIAAVCLRFASEMTTREKAGEA